MDCIGLGDKYSFGVELEFSDAGIEKIKEAFNKSRERVYYCSSHKAQGFNFAGMSCLDLDASVSTFDGNDIIGGEVSSMILHDRKEDWETLSRICKILKDNGAKTNEYCSTHINVNISNNRYNPKFFEILYKLLLIYENEIILYLMGDEFSIRKTLIDYAEPMRLRMLHNIDFVNFEKVPDIIYHSGCFNSKDGVNVFKIRNGILEFRYPNGTLNIDTIQNDVNFVLKIIDAIVEGKFDVKYLDYLIQVLKIDPNFVFDFVRLTEDEESFEELSSIISTSQSDYDSFHKQYKKIISGRKEQRNK